MALSVANSPQAKRSNLALRILSSLVLGPLILAAVYVGEWEFAVIVALLAALGVDEWLRMVLPRRPPGWVRVLAGLGILAVTIAAGCGGAVAGLVVLAAATVAFDIVVNLRLGTPGRMPALGLPYLGLTVVALLHLRQDGWQPVLWLLLVVWATDIGGYIFGRWIGGPKLAPRLSPKKTWAGLVGGAGLAAVAGAAAIAVLHRAGAALLAVPGAALLALVAQAGDLAESAVKRHYGVKDSGDLIPGHGGVLDRIDGLLAAAPVFALFTALLDASFR
ncbi:phosphatidate cytidylyltransferase [Inquilinus sp. OTU3971]|uniref:phosphatidate cytidylyltransferase n=1 Tax=Inquilinus sp. OTU3971 TaxID=3043855 RepID=UPI00313A8F94